MSWKTYAIMATVILVVSGCKSQSENGERNRAMMGAQDAANQIRLEGVNAQRDKKTGDDNNLKDVVKQRNEMIEKKKNELRMKKLSDRIDYLKGKLSKTESETAKKVLQENIARDEQEYKELSLKTTK